MTPPPKPDYVILECSLNLYYPTKKITASYNFPDTAALSWIYIPYSAYCLLTRYIRVQWECYLCSRSRNVSSNLHKGEQWSMIQSKRMISLYKFVFKESRQYLYRWYLYIWNGIEKIKINIFWSNISKLIVEHLRGKILWKPIWMAWK